MHVVADLLDNLYTIKILIDKNGIFEFQEDYLFSSPSSAASQVLARNANSWIECKDKQGRVFDELKRK